MAALAQSETTDAAYRPDAFHMPVGSAMAAMVRDRIGEPAGADAAFSVSMADAATVLWSGFHEFDAADPGWPDRDRFVLSDPDGTPLITALHDLTEHGPDPAEVPPGLPGCGMATGVGLALAERVLAARFGKSLVDHRTWVIASASEMLAGSAYEAACLAGHLRLERLTVLLRASDGDDDLLRRFAALGWATRRVDAVDQTQIASALGLARRSRKPSLIACAGDGPDCGPPRQEAASAWQAAGTRGATGRRAWLKRLARHPHRTEFERAVSGRLPESGMDSLAGLRAELAGTECGATAACVRVVAASAPLLPELLGGVCKDAAPVLTVGATAIGPDQFGARMLDYGARIGTMMSAMAGMAAHGGILPCGAVSLAATDVLRPALRRAAMMRLRTILFARHGIGGPAWQAVEQLAALRAMPNLLMLCPADPVEVAECWEIALRRVDGPSVIVLGPDEATPPRAFTPENRSARGGYVLAEAKGPRQATLVATGSEVTAALSARAMLKQDGIAAAVVSLPVWDHFAQANVQYRNGVLGSAPRFGVEAGGGFGWERWLGEGGTFIGRAGYHSDWITAEAVATAVRKRLSQGH